MHLIIMIMTIITLIATKVKIMKLKKCLTRVIHSIPTIASTSKTTSVPEPMILRIQIIQISMRIEHYFSFLSNQYFLCQTKYSPNIIDSPVDDAGEAVNLCVAQIKDRLAKANDVPGDIL